MTQDQINSRTPKTDLFQLRRHLIASLRITEAQLEIESSLKPEIGKRKEYGA